MRRPAILLASFVAASAASPALAQTQLNGGVIDIEIRLPDGDGGFEVVSETDPAHRLQRRFNRAHCVCGLAGVMNDDTTFGARLSFSTPPVGNVDVPVEIWLGTGCDTTDANQRNTNCGPLPKDTILDGDDISDVPVRALLVKDLMDPAGTEMCPTAEYESAVWTFTDPNNNDVFEDPQHEAVTVDPLAPPLPAKFVRAEGGESAIDLEWAAPTSREEDVDYWQVLCAQVTGDGVVPAFDEAPVESRYDISDALCQIRDSELPAIAEIPVEQGEEGADAAAGPGLPLALAEYDPDYLCGEVVRTGTSIRIEGLTNGAEYAFALLAVDKAGNVAGVTIDHYVIPQPATDFWEDLHERGSDAEGGFCLIADTYGDRGGPGGALTSALRDFRDDTLASTALGRWLTGVYYDHLAPVGELARGSLAARVVLAIVLLPLVLLALAWHVLTLPGLVFVLLMGCWLRRSRAHRSAVAAGVAVLALGGTATAQSFAPYWEDETEIEDSAGPSEVKWHVGIKLGPYVPAIDDQLGDSVYKDMFGGYNLMPMIDVERFFLWPAGQLGAGISIGFLSKTANAYEEGSRDRAPGDKTSFRLLPITANVVYRYTALDDEYGIPLVPYARAGVAYYPWWILAPDGDVAEVFQDGNGDMCDPTVTADCTANKARGATLGVVGALGLSIRAERIDGAAAASMRDGGMYHAGFFAEYQLAKVDGFGRAGKLAVGDNTFFAGVDFEF